MTIKNKAKIITTLLQEHYYDQTKCFLDYQTPWQLLIATILSAQCTDDRVNLVTKDLFQKYLSLEDFAGANPEELEKDVHSTGFYRNKAKNIIAAAQMLLDKYGGQMPSNIDELTTLPGVGRKTANVVRGHIFDLPSVIVDTHVKRVSFKLGLTKNTDPVKIEFDLMDVLPKDSWTRYNTQIITHGRRVCTARSPKCGECFLYDYCIVQR